MKRFVFTLAVIGLILVSCKEEKKSTEAKDSDTGSKATMEELLLTPTHTSKAETVKIVPIEHATAILEWKDITIYIDPIGGADMFKGQKQPDLILITDIHGDHLSVETLKALKTDKSKIIAPQAVADKLPEEFTPQVDVLDNGESKERYGIKIEAIPMYNLREEAKKFHEIGRGNGYVLNIGDQRIYFSGDTEDIPEMRALQNIDKAFVCMNLPYTMTEERAADAVLEFKPKQVYPYHYRGKPDVSDVNEFKQLVEKGTSDIEVVLWDWYPNDPY
ncbi:MBL fold metallo-hydrolase [Maribacter polysaccharolyticus]|uniref:MBL fold metallo-hydrolase n=1 Tax=Maribacter polysaccharolyticus TaxID=3020831 RepID=UPI00237FAED1|nr:MBL fold metallo-hydrolase [Maribacter polysaccharolyticus]MDE3743381.1 MBL fold metallo-hydrolase [Maribacter polysaccharolyticus]